MTDTKISNLPQLNSFIKRLKDDTVDAVKPIIVGTGSDGNVVIPPSSGQSAVKKTLLDGFQMVKNHLEYYNTYASAELDKDEFGGYFPASPPNPDDHLTWLDTFISRNLGGKRDGLYIVWDLPEGRFKLDPWSCSLEKLDVN